jgi:hypothetical protein
MKLGDFQSASSQEAFWIGVREYNTFQDDQYSVGIRMDSQIFTNYAPSEPNDARGVEECVRMKNGK